MSENPFSDGGFDLGAMLEQAQQMQQQLLTAQAELAATSVPGSAGGVTVTLDGTGNLSEVAFGEGSVPGTDAESLTDLGDLIVAAYRDAKAHVDALAQQKLGPLAGGLGGIGGDTALGGPLV